MTEKQVDRALGRLSVRNSVQGKLTPEQIQVRDDLLIKRASYETDKFVKMNEVQGIVMDGLHAIMDKM